MRLDSTRSMIEEICWAALKHITWRETYERENRKTKVGMLNQAGQQLGGSRLIIISLIERPQRSEIRPSPCPLNGSVGRPLALSSSSNAKFE